MGKESHFYKAVIKGLFGLGNKCEQTPIGSGEPAMGIYLRSACQTHNLACSES